MAETSSDTTTQEQQPPLLNIEIGDLNPSLIEDLNTYANSNKREGEPRLQTFDKGIVYPDRINPRVHLEKLNKAAGQLNVTFAVGLLGVSEDRPNESLFFLTKERTAREDSLETINQVIEKANKGIRGDKPKIPSLI